MIYLLKDSEGNLQVSSEDHGLEVLSSRECDESIAKIFYEKMLGFDSRIDYSNIDQVIYLFNNLILITDYSEVDHFCDLLEKDFISSRTNGFYDFNLSKLFVALTDNLDGAQFSNLVISSLMSSIKKKSSGA